MLDDIYGLEIQRRCHEQELREEARKDSLARQALANLSRARDAQREHPVRAHTVASQAQTEEYARMSLGTRVVLAVIAVAVAVVVIASAAVSAVGNPMLLGGEFIILPAPAAALYP